MFSRYGLTLAIVMCTGTANAQEGDIYSALNAVAASQDGEGIAQGIIAVGNTLTAMNVDQTIAFRTSLSLLLASSHVQEDSPEHEMIQVLWIETGRHLIRLCTIDNSREVVGKVNVEFGRPFPCRID